MADGRASPAPSHARPSRLTSRSRYVLGLARTPRQTRFPKGQTMTAPAEITWADALAAFRIAERADREASDHYAKVKPGDPAEPAILSALDSAIDAWSDTMDALIEKAPAPDLAAVAMKIEIAESRTNGEPLLEAHWAAIKADIRRLAQAA